MVRGTDLPDALRFSSLSVSGAKQSNGIRNATMVGVTASGKKKVCFTVPGGGDGRPRTDPSSLARLSRLAILLMFAACTAPFSIAHEQVFSMTHVGTTLAQLFPTGLPLIASNP